MTRSMETHSPLSPRLRLDLRPKEEGVDYYVEDGCMVLMESFLKRRGFCCESGCRHCPYRANSQEWSSKGKFKV